MHSSSVWLEYFYIFKLLWRSGQFLLDALIKQINVQRQVNAQAFRRERDA